MGIDVGGERKGFDLAVIDANLAVVEAKSRLKVSDVVDLARGWAPLVVAIDSPCEAAAPGRHLRECERELNRAVCGIRWTPDMRAINASDYCAWIRNGFKLYGAMESEAAIEVIEVFPTAAWTRWVGRRSATRARWTRAGMARLPLSAVPNRSSQDLRDAVAAALTAWQYTGGTTEAFGEIVVPLPGIPVGSSPSSKGLQSPPAVS